MRVFQGGLLSMLLYIIVIQVLSNFINPDKMTKGIQTKGMQTGDHEILLLIPPSSHEILPALI